METFNPSGGRSTSRRTSPYSYRARSPRLPTPEASHSSNDVSENYDEGHRAGNASFGIATAVLPKAKSGGCQQGGLQHRLASQSPPYCRSELPKPSLPPLRTVISDHVTSPPQTPTTVGAPPHPCPREPIYTATTYRPPALYPNKRPRLEPPSGSASPLPSVNRISLSGATRSLSDRAFPNAEVPSFRENDPNRRYSVQHELLVRRDSAPYPHAPLSSFRSDPNFTEYGNSTAISHSRPSGGLRNLPSPRPDYALRGPSDYVPISTPCVDFPGPLTMRVGGSVEYLERSDSPARLASERADCFEPFRGVERPPHDEHGSRSEEHNGNPHLPLRSAPPVVPPTRYETMHCPPFFTPSQYEYQHGKARKRSNLPKSSTEIMKTWFDQNIANPYPSEEQKAHFSRITGISMTQVSNWFINHRRRCPELRDRRERQQTGDGGL
ncbi:hypothetical protein BAUCODRAFT_212345 [Baudoinia panamericana UAMH 10762]|uniref:Homeobox domain-containing protein n=1 Tax=Baudoinia panamericana (strain UAMH 10762) TaxID=717646 RepID=M2N4A0_BAUPA|nr:uncharacterized protein BAUCODRAFT_212345 [Baudoinia panamericana UAMH 10762]EMC93849.1 hypothetical protein BAUCODRAFT_212345 [Baudoinia panamericana UAMH 10762]